MTLLAGERFRLDQPSRRPTGRRMRPREYMVLFVVQPDGTARHVGGVKPRTYYQAFANLCARNGDHEEWREGLRDGFESDAPAPGENRHPDYRDGFAVGRDPHVRRDEFRSEGHGHFRRRG